MFFENPWNRLFFENEVGPAQPATHSERQERQKWNRLKYAEAFTQTREWMESLQPWST